MFLRFYLLLFQTAHWAGHVRYAVFRFAVPNTRIPCFGCYFNFLVIRLSSSPSRLSPYSSLEMKSLFFLPVFSLKIEFPPAAFVGVPAASWSYPGYSNSEDKYLYFIHLIFHSCGQTRFVFSLHRHARQQLIQTHLVLNKFIESKKYITIIITMQLLSFQISHQSKQFWLLSTVPGFLC